MIQIIILLLVALSSIAEAQVRLVLHESPRVMGMAGAFVAVADDPQASVLNPAGLRNVPQIGHDFTFSTAPGPTPDQLATALANPGTEYGAVFGTAFLAQGLMDDAPVKYYVAQTGLCWTLFGQSTAGVNLRFPYRTSDIDSIPARWEALADLSVLQAFGNMRLGAQIERAFGGASDMVPRRLRTGISVGRPGEYVLAYEWRGGEGQSKYNFRYESSHLGGEIITEKYVAIRGGYIWSESYFLTAGLAIGMIKQGWRVETGWQFPTGKSGDTHWSVGIGYRG